MASIRPCACAQTFLAMAMGTINTRHPPTTSMDEKAASDVGAPAAKRARRAPATPSTTLLSMPKAVSDYLKDWCARLAECSYCGGRSIPGGWFQCGRGGHPLCGRCARTRNACRLCSAEWDKSDPPPNRAVEFTVNELNAFIPMACGNSIHGCGHVDTNVKRYHLSHCKYRVLPCVFDGGKCTSIETTVGGILARNMATHVDNHHMCIEADSSTDDYKSYEFLADNLGSIFDTSNLSQIVPLDIDGTDAYFCWCTKDSKQCSVSVLSAQPLPAAWHVEISTESANGWRDWVKVPATLFTEPREDVTLPYVRGARQTHGQIVGIGCTVKPRYGGWGRVRVVKEAADAAAGICKDT